MCVCVCVCVCVCAVSMYIYICEYVYTYLQECVHACVAASVSIVFASLVGTNLNLSAIT